MNLSLEVFIKVVEKMSFSKAAEELHMTQPAVSQYIRSLEEELGVRLLERNNKLVRLNRAGEIVYHHAKEIVALDLKMHNLIADLTNQAAGRLAIGASYTFGEYILPHIIARLQANYPQIRPTITIHNTKEITDLVKTYQLDIGLIEGNLPDNRLHSEIVAEDLMSIVASPKHRLLGRRITMADLADETWILREKGSGTREAAENLFESLKFAPPRIMEFGSIQIIKESVEAGLGISLLSNWAIRKELANGYMGAIDVKGLPFKRNLSVVMQSNFQTKALRLFIGTVKEFLEH
jgi:DNA-binding transcriptional LysR family regulator